MNDSRYYAIRDIAHRWFAFFEGQTESLEEHLQLFTPDVRLVHAGQHLLAEGQSAMADWLKQVPPATDSHFINALHWQPTSDNRARVEMEIGYQVMQNGELVGGAVIEYQTEVVFTESGEAAFSFLQKTPVRQNPDREFKDSFAANRLGASAARIDFLLTTCQADQIAVELMEPDAGVQWQQLIAQRGAETLTSARTGEQDETALSLTLKLSGTQSLSLLLTEQAGRYLKVRAIELD
ncbi:hypothetical protein [Marinobacterium lutimaris]|uniref:SnoaL-like domain-containing protein n=1 Tax=Marinobacterium lutimaris TaxID=568106 RepID=A0A1H6C3L5_9GAMM|nr:hypothetical protein [Marinobacterium lutimaris]SEG67522.1 hypothetical protein SAMN05444390_103140 [Marinobacterium lutimaris]